MKELLGALGYLGIHQFVSLVFGLVRSKIIAALLGPFGMGIFSQASTVMDLSRQVSSMGIHDGFLKLVSDYKNHQDQVRLGKTIITAVFSFGLIGVFLLLLTAVFSGRVSTWIFDDPGYFWFVWIGIVAGVLSAEYFTFLTIYQALLKWKEYALVSVIGYIFNLFLAAALIFTLQLWGAVLSMMAAQLVNLLIVVFVLRQRVLPRGFGRLFNHRPDLNSFKSLMRYVGPLSTIALVAAFTTLLIRSAVVHRLGADANGIYQVVYAISLAYMGLVRNAFMAFGLPKVTELLSEPQKILSLQNNELRLGLLILSPLVLFLMLTRNIWIPLLYSTEFLTAAPLLIWQFTSDLLRMMRITMNISLLPLDRLGFVLVDGLIDWLGWLVLAILLLPVMGIAAVPFSHMIASLVSLVVSYLYHRYTSFFRIDGDNLRLLLKAAGLLAPGMLLVQYGQGFVMQALIPLILMLVMLVWLPRKDDYRKLFAFIQEKLVQRGQKNG